MADPNAPTEEDIKRQQLLNDLKKAGMDEQNRLSEEQLKIAQQVLDTKKKERQFGESRMQDILREVNMLAELNELEKNKAVHRARQAEIEKLMEQSKEVQLKVDEQRLQKMMDAGDTASEQYQTLKKQIIEQRKSLKNEKILNKQREEGVEHQRNIIKGISQSMLNQSKFGKALGGGIDGMFKMQKAAKGLNAAIKSGAVSMGMLTAATGIGLILLAVGAVAKLVETIMKLAIQTRDATVAFQRATGASKEFGAAIPKLERDMRAVGVSMEEASAAQKALYTSTTDYTMASASAREDLLKTTALMGEFGVSVETSAKIAQAATKGLGMGIGDADDLLLRLSAHASDIGVPVNKMMEDFASASNELKVFGRDGEAVFKRLAQVSKITGMEVNRILDIVGKFDTFEGAAKQAGMLNAAVGGNMVNAMDLMMTTDPVERFSMIKDSIEGAAGSFDDMSYYQKRFYVNALGLKDVGELAAMMSGDFNELDGSIGKTSADFEKQREKAKNWQSTMEILKNTVMAMAPTFEKLSVKIQEMLEEFSRGEGPLKDIGDLFGNLLEKEMLDLLADAPEKISNFVNNLNDFATSMKEVKGYAEDFFNKLKIGFSIFTGIAVALLAFATPLGWVGSLIAGLVAGVGAFIAMIKKKNSPSFLDLFTGGVLAKGFNGVKDTLQAMMEPIKKVINVFKSLGETIANTFNFDNIKETVSGFVDWLPGTWGESVDGIKTEMEIASPSKKMEREIINPTFVEPMQSVSAQMPQLVEEVYKEVSFKGPATEMRTSLEREKMNQAMTPTNIQNNVTAGANTTTVVEKTHQNVTIPINIGGEEIGTIVADIVEGKIGNISMKGIMGLG